MAVLALVICMIAGSSFAAKQSPEGIFLQNLIGPWKGRAIRTPVGPVSYDITFARIESGAVTGTANPGAALHHWRFFVANGQLRLRFLSTFRGNTKPTWLYTEEVSSVGAFFRGRDLEHLTVNIEMNVNELRIDIFLHDAPHVSIRLAPAGAG
ncbi:MAG: hypothetical protein O7H40_00960 [Gammaproteobacteria bacterium]|nr:hypothetical protein [Gammaproteobacteria bacterium]